MLISIILSSVIGYLFCMGRRVIWGKNIYIDILLVESGWVVRGIYREILEDEEWGF